MGFLTPAGKSEEDSRIVCLPSLILSKMCTLKAATSKMASPQLLPEFEYQEKQNIPIKKIYKLIVTFY